MSEQKDNLNKIKEKLKHPRATSLRIKRVPAKIVKVFKEYANEEFVGDYGMALRELVNTVLIDADKFQHVYDVLTEHEERLRKIEGKDHKKVIRTISGRKIKIKDEKKEANRK